MKRKRNFEWYDMKLNISGIHARISEHYEITLDRNMIKNKLNANLPFEQHDKDYVIDRIEQYIHEYILFNIGDIESKKRITIHCIFNIEYTLTKIGQVNFVDDIEVEINEFNFN